MGNPFQDQLLKAGLVTKKQVGKAKHDTRVSKKKNKNKAPQTGPTKVQLAQAAEKKRIKKLNKKLRLKQQEEEKQAQIKQLIGQNQMKQDGRGEPYNFVDGVKIKRIFVARDISEQISCGKAAIVRSSTGYAVVPRNIAEQISNRDTSIVLVLHDGKPEDY